MLQERVYDDKGESVQVYEGILVFGCPQGTFFSVIGTVSSRFTGILGDNCIKLRTFCQILVERACYRCYADDQNLG